MAEFERERRRPPVWRSSEGRLREAAPVRKKDGRDHLTGYEPAEGEKRRRPREAARLSGSYADIAVGTTRKKELAVMLSKRRSREGPAALRDERALHGDSARPLNLARGAFAVNAHDSEKSALLYRELRQKSPTFLIGRFREMMRTHSQSAAEEQAPFLDRRPEREELRALQERSDELRAKGGPGSRAALRAAERRRQELRQALGEKETQERRLRLILLRAQEESFRRSRRSGWETKPAVPRQTPDAPPDSGAPGAPKPPRGRHTGAAAAVSDTPEKAQGASPAGENGANPETEGGPPESGERNKPQADKKA